MGERPAQPWVHVSEVFGPTVQGEGPYTGRACVFVRLGGCNLTCQACDTPYTWDGSRFDLRAEIMPLPADLVCNQVRQLASGLRPPLVVLSGGEPLIHQGKPGMRALVTTLCGDGYEVHVETNGTLAPARWLVDLPMVRWVVSPKVVGPLATDPVRRRLVSGALGEWVRLARAGRAHFKIVIGHPAQVEQVVDFARRFGVPRELVYVMPEGQTARRVLEVGQGIAEAACREGFGVCTRLHLLLWPDESRGR